LSCSIFWIDPYETQWLPLQIEFFIWQESAHRAKQFLAQFWPIPQIQIPRICHCSRTFLWVMLADYFRSQLPVRTKHFPTHCRGQTLPLGRSTSLILVHPDLTIQRQ
jgi:hypothetical protein